LFLQHIIFEEALSLNTEWLPILNKSAIFSGIKDDEIETLLNCLSATYHEYKKGEFIFMNDESFDRIGLIVKGQVQISKSDYWGHKTIISHLKPAQIFGEVYACVGKPAYNITGEALEKTGILLLDLKRIMTKCSQSCVFHQKLIDNLLYVISSKAMMLNQKIDDMSQRTTKGKVLSYLSNQAKKHGQNTFKIPFNRQAMADYLSVDRSALSKELGKLRDEGIISFKGSMFTLLHGPEEY
jgi:CRP-like cAMP-binding protein